MNNIRVAIFHNGADSSVEYANQLNERLVDEAVVLDVHDPRPVRTALPIRATPSLCVMLFFDPAEENQDTESILRQLDLIRNLPEVEQLVAELSTSGVLSKNAKTMAANLFTATLPE